MFSFIINGIVQHTGLYFDHFVLVVFKLVSIMRDISKSCMLKTEFLVSHFICLRSYVANFNQKTWWGRSSLKHRNANHSFHILFCLWPYFIFPFISWSSLFVFCRRSSWLLSEISAVNEDTVQKLGSIA